MMMSFCTTGDREETVFVDEAEIACSVEAIDLRCHGHVRVAVVSVHDEFAPYNYFADVTRTYLNPIWDRGSGVRRTLWVVHNSSGARPWQACRQ